MRQFVLNSKALFYKMNSGMQKNQITFRPVLRIFNELQYPWSDLSDPLSSRYSGQASDRFEKYLVIMRTS